MEKLSKIFYGVEILSPFLNEKESLYGHDRITSPNSYLVKMIFTWLTGERLEEGYYRSDWIISLKYRGFTWLLEDDEASAWYIYGEESASQDAEILIKKITSAAKIMNQYVSEVAKNEINRNEFLLINHFDRINSFYQLFRFETELLIRERNEPEIEPSKFANLFRSRAGYQKKIEANVTAAIFFFFSLTEIILDCCYSLGERYGLTFNDFRNTSWSERFKNYFPVGGGEFNTVFTQLLEIRDANRNAFAHAEPIFMLWFDRVGWIPRDVRDLHRPIMGTFNVITEKEAKIIFDTFDRALTFIKRDPFGQYVSLYVQSGLPIQMIEDNVRELRNEMTSLEDFADEITRRLKIQDAYDNWDF